MSIEPFEKLATVLESDADYNKRQLMKTKDLADKAAYEAFMLAYQGAATRLRDAIKQARESAK